MLVLSPGESLASFAFCGATVLLPASRKVTCCCSCPFRSYHALASDLPLKDTMERRSKSKETMVTIKDVAKESGFSSSTVSIVLNDAPLARYIPHATKSTIEKAAKKLGYRPNLF